MNIFVVDQDPNRAAADLCDKHVVKMIVESAQMLSTAHRVLDGVQTTRTTKSGRTVKHWRHPELEDVLCLPTMVNHPCTRWVMESADNYHWLWLHTTELLRQYTVRYDKVHSMYSLITNPLAETPKGIHISRRQTPFAQAMPDQYRNSDAVLAYRNYYLGEKRRFAKWKKTQPPAWWQEVTE